MRGVGDDVLVTGAPMKYIAIARANSKTKNVKNQEPFTKAKHFHVTNTKPQVRLILFQTLPRIDKSSQLPSCMTLGSHYP